MDVIGKGAFGVVYRAVNRHRGNWVAIKQVKLNKKKKSQLSSLMVRISSLFTVRFIYLKSEKNK
jgi:serine/threonine protein kinase